MAVLFAAIAIVAKYLMQIYLTDTTSSLTFSSFEADSDIVVIIPPASPANWHIPFLDIINQTYHNDTGRYPNFSYFEDYDQFNKYVYEIQANRTGPSHIVMGFAFNGNMPTYNITALYNRTLGRSQQSLALSQVSRIMWKHKHGIDTDFYFTSTQLLQELMNFMFGQLAPMLITCGLICVLPIIFSQPIIDIKGEVRSYMQSCSLQLFPYWVACFVFDFIVWTILVIVVWVIYIAFDIVAVTDNLFTSWYSFMMMGPSFIILCYCFSFAFKESESGIRQMLLILVITLIIPMLIDVVRNGEIPYGVEWFYSLFPHILLNRLLSQVMVRISILNQSFGSYWRSSTSYVYLIMQIVDIPIYIVILIIIEKVRILIAKKHAKSVYTGYEQLFSAEKAKHPITKEAKDMEEKVHQYDDDSNFVVRILNVSRLFFNAEGQPIPAVNDVSLGVKENSIFGFLGANGAGKTTLIKMITSLLPPSTGTIEIFGTNINNHKYSQQLLTVCPQFNTHLCFEMTPREHFYLYQLICQLDPQEAVEHSQQLIETLNLQEHVDKTVRELSGGNQRKLAVALAFYNNSKLVLLDEPTSSLDPVARHHVHEMINEHRGKKTFMLCTHLLSEAEALCDEISIMIKGCVYTCGSPQYLSEKFGTAYKIDLILKDDGENNDEKVSEFFRKELPESKLSIVRPNVRIYEIPSNVITLGNLFEKMEEGKKGDNGFRYYTCSSSSLERVFMEIVHLSESKEDEAFSPP
ncbi:ABC transporter family protein [Histomonas meleagridis]|uniref:ABC transporter family protein n=1 Tax=Histomonas meleagridis TaxID=135588 RepID=UPI00355A363B|nr:ABC transporter family protein [Histomonas meleagridis]KAH0804134.1 ABC transporter family protein [Histomonas meleagridis]